MRRFLRRPVTAMYDCQASVSTQQKDDRKKKCRKAATSVHTTCAGQAGGSGRAGAGHPAWARPTGGARRGRVGPSRVSGVGPEVRSPSQEATEGPAPASQGAFWGPVAPSRPGSLGGAGKGRAHAPYCGSGSAR